ncbi:hypothetical protein I5M32_07395 [Pedobacter sp. SD-b]|uniref:Bacterial virulence domain-containing protein n=1 Tax=Pedobacter segetis TaxID=2793069 RepID=A0ABS1BKC7_9SPHI|nr:AcvB/VirJ family lysyl-phosphatidylglycerol hydrolase [Pedobacter segetis]MBK0382781.1 hypothetical protein [Pedobacter segetis]
MIKIGASVNNAFHQKIFFFCLFAVVISSSGCAILNKNRVTKNRGIPKADFDLPIIVYPTKVENTKTMIVFLSGDGGWLTFDDNLAVAFSENGFNTLGFNSRSYFWDKKTPKQIGKDLSALIQVYLKNFDCKNVVLCGYSFGADVVPFIYSNLNLKEKIRVKSLILLSPFASTDFVVYTADLLNLGGDNRKFKVAKEVEKIRLPISCYYGKEEEPKPLSGVNKRRFHLYELNGGHKYTEDAIPTIVKNLIKHYVRKK